jgi:hypothetical protein
MNCLAHGAGRWSAQRGRLYSVLWSKEELAHLERALQDVEADPGHNKRAFFKEVFDRFSECQLEAAP